MLATRRYLRYWGCCSLLSVAALAVLPPSSGPAAPAPDRTREGARRTPVVFAPEESAAEVARVQVRSYILEFGAGPNVTALEEDKRGKRTPVVIKRSDLAKEARVRKLAEETRQLRVAVVAASFPLKKQVEEFRAKLGLRSANAVLEETWAGTAGEERVLPAFRFLGVRVERREVDAGGKPQGAWRALALEKDYMPWLYRVGKRFEPEEEQLKALRVRGLVMPRLPLFRKGENYPVVEKRLLSLQKALKGLAKKDIPEHCLVRILDVTVQPGRTYEYRLKVRMANPNYERKDVAVPRDAKKIELESGWSRPVRVRSLPDFLF